MPENHAFLRIWSLHPQYLDAKGLVALWRETLLAKHVLSGKTKGYRQHPQLLRFKQTPQPLHAIDVYLAAVHQEAVQRNYNFNRDKVNWKAKADQLTVTEGQLQYEFEHLLRKLEQREPERFHRIRLLNKPKPHPMFRMVPGSIEDWEVLPSTAG